MTSRPSDPSRPGAASGFAGASTGSDAVDLVALSRSGGVHFMGVGGAGMVALAELTLRAGGRVSGCDLSPGPATTGLEELGAWIVDGHDPSHVEDVSAVVVTSAVPQDHPELERARERGIPVLKRALALGGVVNRGTVVAVAGTHGKTTTTAMATEVLAVAGMDPTGFVGGPVASWKGHLRPGSNRLFVVEADEYDRSFHTLVPNVAVVTNLEADHLDVYDDLEGVREAFHTFLARLRPSGRAIVCADDPGASRLVAATGEAGYTYGLSAGSQLRAVDVELAPERTRFRVVEGGVDRGVLAVGAPGLHNLRNALAAAAVARHLGVEWSAVGRGLAAFAGVGRRFQRLGERRGVTVVDDYAHHPTEIEATVDALRTVFQSRRIVAVFQPHLFTRTRDFAARFGEALAEPDVTWITDVYPAREKPIPGVTGEVVAGAARASGAAEVHYHPALDTLAAAVVPTLRTGDVVVTMGAGSVDRIGPELLRLLDDSDREADRA